MIEEKNNVVAVHLDEIIGILHDSQGLYLRAAESLIHDYKRANGINKYPADLQLCLDLLGKLDDTFEYLIPALDEDRKILAGEMK